MPATIDALDELAKPEHRQDPYPFLHWLREHDPVHRTRCGFYLLSNYDDVAFALRQDTAFTAPDEAAMWAEIGHGKRSHPAVRKLVAAFTAKHHPCYARLRAAVAGDLTPARVLRLRPRILEHLGNVFDDIGPRLVAGETVDLHAEVSVPLTQHVFADRIGLPEQDRSWIADTIALMTRALRTDEVTPEADLASDAVEDYFRARLAERKASPRDDLISRLVEAHDDEDLLIAILWIMWMTGYESTISGIDRAVQAFLTHPEHRSWCDDDQSRVQRFIDETLRHDDRADRTRRRGLRRRHRPGRGVGSHGDRRCQPRPPRISGSRHVRPRPRPPADALDRQLLRHHARARGDGARRDRAAAPVPDAGQRRRTDVEPGQRRPPGRGDAAGETDVIRDVRTGSAYA
jgi:hypothetical protein